MAQKYNLRRGLKKRYRKLFPPRRTASAATSTTPLIKCHSVVQEDLTNETETSSVTNSKSHGLPSRPSPDPQIARPSVEPRLADFQAASTSQVACLAISPERPAQVEPLARPNPTVSVSEEIWNTAYDDLEATEGELVRSYVKILKEVLGRESGEPSTSDLVAEMKDPLQRQKKT
ncbi:hypothetical protein GGS24DRAFT_452549 [Hypoxylon argillaceum]|nr:hypothetical protein GGS24DRAFT_452549 [Hypoxylon argillaceum]